MKLLPTTCDLLCQVLQLRTYPLGSKHEIGLEYVTRAVGELLPIYLAALKQGAEGDQICRAICGLSSTLGEEEIDFIARGSPEALKVVELQVHM